MIRELPPPPIQRVIPSIRLAAVKTKIAAANDLSASIDSGLTSAIPSKNGCAFSMNRLNDAPKSGIIFITASANPRIILPKKLPKAFPIILRIGIPSSRNLFTSGTASVSAPIPTNKAPRPTIKVPRAASPIKAPEPSLPTSPKRTKDADIETSKSDSDLAFSIAEPGSIPAAIYNTPTSPSINNSKIPKLTMAFRKAFISILLPNVAIIKNVPPTVDITIDKAVPAAKAFPTGN